MKINNDNHYTEPDEHRYYKNRYNIERFP